MNYYLQNNICNFTPLFNTDYNTKINILSASFFKIKENYKNFNIYINRLKSLIKIINNQNNYVLRLFIDNHIYNNEQIMQLFKSSNKIQLIKFHCNNYFSDDYHIKLFPTLIRLFPLFNFNNNDANNVVIVDIDLNNEDLLKLKTILNYNTTDKEIIALGNAKLLLIDKLIYTGKKIPFVHCGLFAQFNFKFDHNIITNFIHNITNPEYQVEKYNFIYKSHFEYGVDEIFLNNHIFCMDTIKKYDFKTNIIFAYNINFFLYYLKNILLNHKKSNKYLSYILGSYFTSDMTNSNMINFIDEVIYNGNNKQIIKYISNRYYKLIKYLYKNNKSWFDIDSIKLIYKFYYKKNIINSISIIHFNYESKEIINIINN